MSKLDGVLRGEFFCKIREEHWILDGCLGFNMCTTKPCALNIFPRSIGNVFPTPSSRRRQGHRREEGEEPRRL
jgi:hypothetical protein